MNIVSTHRRKLEPKRRFGGREFRTKIKSAANYKRVFNTPPSGWANKFWAMVGLSSKIWRWTLGLVLAVAIYFLFISNYFLVTDIQVTGNSQIPTETIEAAIREGTDSRQFLMKSNHVLLMTEGRVNRVLTARLPNIKGISKFHRTWPNQIAIEVQERVPGFVIKSENNYFLVDEDGTVVDELTEPGKFLVAEDQARENFARGEILPNPKLATFLVSMNRQWSTKINTPITMVKFPGKAGSDLQFVTQEGWSVMFDTSRPVAVQLTNLTVLLTKEIGARRGQLAYIDLRLSKAYYCFKSSPCEQPAQTINPDPNALP